jgi:16S rRNA (uracil1498-N3)-methyltransferase
LRRVARSAVEQCGRSWLPELSAGDRLDRALDGGDHDAAIVLDPDAPRGDDDLMRAGAGSMVVVVGPEGGFTSAELELARRCGALPMRLVPSLLRVETAALAAAAWALIQAESGGVPAPDRRSR